MSETVAAQVSHGNRFKVMHKKLINLAGIKVVIADLIWNINRFRRTPDPGFRHLP